MKVALFGAVRASAEALDSLASSGVELHVFSLAPSKASRHSDYLDLGPLAIARGVSSTSLEDINASSTLTAVRAFAPDLICVFGWSQLVREEFLALPRLGVLGWHPAMLPLNRGRAVIPWTILQDVRESGFTIFWIDSGMDSGDIATQVPVWVAPDETAASLYDKMQRAAAEALAALVPSLRAGQLPRRAQRHEDATYCARRDREDGRIDWSATAVEVERLIRACGEPYPGAFTESRLGDVVVVAAQVERSGHYWGIPGQVQWVDGDGVVVACGDRSALRIRIIRPAGLELQPAHALLRMHEHLGARARRSP